MNFANEYLLLGILYEMYITIKFGITNHEEVIHICSKTYSKLSLDGATHLYTLEHFWIDVSFWVDIWIFKPMLSIITTVFNFNGFPISSSWFISISCIPVSIYLSLTSPISLHLCPFCSLFSYITMTSQ